VERMISEDSYDCAAVLNVLVSARRAVKSLSEKIITDHIEHCLKPDAPEGTCRAQLKEIQTMLRRYVE
jgi:DNA-binding FrmR family transcriptional regulator